MPMTCKEAIAAWEKDKELVAAEAEVVELQFRWPPIEKMDGALSTLAACKKLSLSTNMIDKIAGIAGMRNLKILSLGRNYIKALSGIETVADTLEELWISYNPIDKLKGINAMKQLKVFYMANALIKEPTTCKEAIAAWEKEKGLVAAEAEEIELQFRWPPIEKMDASLSTLTACKKLSLSTNMIEKISGIGGMKNLKILALGRNQIKSLTGIEVVADTLEELWISNNQLEKLKGVGAMKKLRVLYMSNNNLKDWAELSRLQDCPALRDLLLIGNPIYDTELDMEVWRQRAINRLPQITQLDGIPVVRDTEQREKPIVENADGIANQN